MGDFFGATMSADCEHVHDMGGTIKKIRGKSSREKFAELLGIGASTLVRYESNERTPDADFLLKMNLLYGVDPMYLLTGRTTSLGGLNQVEVDLLNAFRSASDDGRKAIVLCAKAVGLHTRHDGKTNS
jgi:transcriptional regulator with XRE-family HTH domain